MFGNLVIAPTLLIVRRDSNTDSRKKNYLAMAKDHVAILYYSIVLTTITVIVAMVIGMIQMLSLVLNVAQPEGRFWVGPISRRVANL